MREAPEYSLQYCLPSRTKCPFTDDWVKWAMMHPCDGEGCSCEKEGEAPYPRIRKNSRMYGSAQKAKYRAEQSRAYSTVHFGKKGRGKNGCLWLLVLASRNPRWILKKSVKVITFGEWGRADEDRSDSKTSHKMPFLFWTMWRLYLSKKKKKSQRHGRISKVLCWANEDLHKRLLTLDESINMKCLNKQIYGGKKNQNSDCL